MISPNSLEAHKKPFRSLSKQTIQWANNHERNNCFSHLLVAAFFPLGFDSFVDSFRFGVDVRLIVAQRCCWCFFTLFFPFFRGHSDVNHLYNLILIEFLAYSRVNGIYLLPFAPSRSLFSPMPSPTFTMALSNSNHTSRQSTGKYIEKA